MYCTCISSPTFPLTIMQSSVTETDKSQLEQYLQEELETMRQAFQIRLGQLEKRYQRQLVMEQHRNISKQPQTPSSAVVQRRRNFSLDQANNSQRRNSWHSYITSEQELDKLAQPDEPRSGSSLGIDSDFSIEGSDTEDWEETQVNSRERTMPRRRCTTVAAEQQNTNSSNTTSAATAKSHLDELPESLRDQSRGMIRAGMGDIPIYATPRPTKPKEGLKGGDKSWRAELEGSKKPVTPQLSLVSNELSKDEVGAVDDDAKELIQKKIVEYREKMAKYFQEKSEAQICIIEEKYQKQMDEVRRKYDKAATKKLSHLTTRIKDLENMIDVQTVV